MKSTSITFSTMDPRHIKPDVRNSRTHSKKQVDQIAASIAEHGFVNPILINLDSLIIAGHGRLRAAKQLGLAEVPVITVSGLTDAQERRLRIADNKIALNAGWDIDLLKVELDEIEMAGLDLTLTGFSTSEIDLLRDIKLEPEQRVFTSSTDAVSQLGDIWICGEHRVMCGDLLIGGSLDGLMAGERADTVFTDPPFNTQNDGHNGGNGQIVHREFAYAHGEMSVEEFTGFLKGTLGELARVSRDGAVHFVCMDHHHAGELIEAGAVPTWRCTRPSSRSRWWRTPSRT